MKWVHVITCELKDKWVRSDVWSSDRAQLNKQSLVYELDNVLIQLFSCLFSLDDSVWQENTKAVVGYITRNKGEHI